MANPYQEWRGPETIFDEAIELAVMEATIYDPAVRPTALLPTDFYRAAHCEVWREVCAVVDAGDTPNQLTISARLRARGESAAAEAALGLGSWAAADYLTALDGWVAALLALTERRAADALGRALVEYAYDPHAATARANIARYRAKLDDIQRRLLGDEGDTARELRFRLLSDEEIMDLEPAVGIVGNILFEDTIACLYAREGRWKTFLALDWAMCCASGRVWHGRHVTAGPAVYIAAEGAHGIGKRIAAWKAHHEVCEPTAIKVLGRPVQLMDAVEVRQLIADIRAQVFDGNPVLVVIDTLARSMIGGDENSARDINTVTAAAYAIKEAFGCCVLVVHHSGKDEERGLRGSSALRGNSDTIIRVSSKNENEPTIAPGDPVTVRCEKTKDDAPFLDITLTAQVVTVVRENGVTFDSLVLAPADPATVQEAMPPLTRNQQQALDVLYQAMPEGLSATKWYEATGLSKSTFYDARDLLSKRQFVECSGKIYFISECGEEQVSASLRQKSEMSDRTPKDQNRSPKHAADAEITNPEFMGTELGPVSPTPIGSSDFRTNLVHQAISHDHIHDFSGPYRSPNGSRQCRNCEEYGLPLPVGEGA